MLVNRTRNISFFFISVLLLFLSFQYNFFHSASAVWFENFQVDSQSLVVGRLIESDRSGISSNYGLLGRELNEDGSIISIYDNDSYVLNKFETYTSQVGLQGVVFGIVNEMLSSAGMSSAPLRFEVLQILTSFSLAVVLSLLLLIFSRRFGFLSVTVALFFLVFSQWLVVMARNLYWVPFTMFLPLLFTTYAFNKPGRINAKIVFIILTILFFLRSSCGYEYISTVTVASLCPLILYAIQDSWKRTYFLKNAFLILFSSVSGFLIANTLHVFLIAKLKNESVYISFVERIYHAKTRLYTSEDTFSSGSWLEATKATTSEVIAKYFHGNAFDFSNFLGFSSFYTIDFGQLVLIFCCFSFLSLISVKYSKNIDSNRRNVLSLTAVTWFSFLAPLSWFILAKVHSYVHTHINFFIWNVPFVIFGVLLIGYILYLIALDVFEENKFVTGGVKIIILSILFIFVCFPLLYQRHQFTMFHDDVAAKNVFNYTSPNNIKVYLMKDSQIVFYLQKCSSKSISDRFFVHLYPLDKPSLNGAHQFLNFDFNWEERAIYKGLYTTLAHKCMASIYYPSKLNLAKIVLGQVTPRGVRTWEKTFNE